ncbi:hypothetical protein KJE20_10843 [Pyrenophora tritici-repentis]|nr:hypothetical protein KJE20_10843 [Pyrenophora tritici-repentis]
MGVTCKQVPTEAHWSVGKTERYHAPLRRAWDILHDELQDDMSDEAILQMAVKAVNDTAGPDGLVPTLLVFGAYPRMTTESPPAPSMVRRSEAIQKATKALRKLTAERQVADALNTRNGPATADMLALPLQSEVLVWRESDGWNGPYKIASIDGHNVTVDMVNGPTTFRSTVVKPYYRPDHLWSDPDAPHALNEPHEPKFNITAQNVSYFMLNNAFNNDTAIATLRAKFSFNLNKDAFNNDDNLAEEEKYLNKWRKQGLLGTLIDVISYIKTPQ